jgi:superfamily I DNA and/or RNA helicase
MIPAIGDLISDVFYDGQLKSFPREPKKSVITTLGKAVVWRSTSGLDARQDRGAETSFVNVLEANVARMTLDSLDLMAKAAGETLTVVVLTGYAAQRDQLRRTLSNSTWSHIRVSVETVDAYQGKEADVAIFSLTRSNPKFMLGFLSSRRRINVALSRGRDGLVIIGDDEFCRRAGDRANPMGEVLTYLERHPDHYLVEGAEL